MREVIVTDLTRFSKDENVCTAVIEPMPYLKNAKCQELGIHPGAILNFKARKRKSPRRGRKLF